MGTVNKQINKRYKKYSYLIYSKGIIFLQGKQVDKYEQQRQQEYKYLKYKQSQSVRSIKTLKRKVKNKIAKQSRKRNRL